MTRAKLHMHDEQFDGAQRAMCGRADSSVSEAIFEAADPKDRCQHCERIWFPHGQPEWHRMASQQAPTPLQLRPSIAAELAQFRRGRSCSPMADVIRQHLRIASQL